MFRVGTLCQGLVPEECLILSDAEGPDPMSMSGLRTWYLYFAQRRSEPCQEGPAPERASQPIRREGPDSEEESPAFEESNIKIDNQYSLSPKKKKIVAWFI